MKKYTNKILIITIIVVVLAMVIGRTVDFQTGYRNGRITYEERDPDSLEMVLRDIIGDDDDTTAVETHGRASLQEDEPASDNKPEMFHQ